MLNAMASRRHLRTPGSDRSSNGSVESRIGRGQDFQLRDVGRTGTVEPDAELNESTQPSLTEELRIDRMQSACGIGAAATPNGLRLSCGASASGRKRPVLRYLLASAQTFASSKSRPRQLQALVRQHGHRA